MSDRRHPEHTHSAQQGTDQTQRIHQPHPRYTDPAYGGQSPYPPPYYSGSPPDPNSARSDRQAAAILAAGSAAAGSANAGIDTRAAESTALALGRGGRGSGAGDRIGHRLGDRERHSRQANRRAGTTGDAEFAKLGPDDVHVALTFGRRHRDPHHSKPASPGMRARCKPWSYNVSGEGRAISITYVDNDGMTQTEFNVALPWSKDVSLPSSGSRTPNVTIVNIGHDVTCSVTVDGVEINQRTGVGLTVCNGSG